MEAQNTKSGEALLREIEQSADAATRTAWRILLTVCSIPIVFTAALWLFAMLAN